MRLFIACMAGAILLAGCCATPDVDREYGMATMTSLAAQIAYPAGLNSDKTPQGMPGIHSEAIMEAYHGSFNDTQQADASVFELDLTGGSSQ
ncbi:MAG: hypothetical protein C0616_03370 [Desulfuromonas sp.]|nr:MAG: hypothetical protein C0616_03370 [Desulfuromonas sp.]